ncbi:MAG: hypothetical protein CYPHOPRED_004324 [Cyphobasidiales sp. Tagirdzhanova-0007]|nr:MAG: hypothetical protein CYPHOPRED_004324 [Cyphobasidiales sp. Tagirdzhanova-0007]
MRAVVVQEGKTVKVQEIPIPDELKENEVLLKVVAVGLNPTDWKHVATLSRPGDVSGCDFVGTVQKSGSAVPADLKGQLRSGFVRGGTRKDNGAFAEYVRTPWDITFEVPMNITPQQAASAPIPLFTVCQAFYLRLGFPRPGEDNNSLEGKWIVIWSGSTSVGQYAIQLAKLSGLKIATTASTKKYDMLKKLGADVVLDYKESDVSQKLRKATSDSIVYGLDTISENGSIQLVQQAFGSSGGHLVCTLFDLGEPARKDVKTESTLSYTCLGQDQTWGPLEFKTSKEDRANMVACCKLATKLFQEGKIRPLDVTDVGDIDKIQKGLDMLKNGENPTKLVHTISAL